MFVLYILIKKEKKNLKKKDFELVSTGIPVVACFDRPKEPDTGPQSKISSENFSQS